ncbi:nucleotidyltransferase family protein [Candidatus Woesearchaeota archaeon]|nr:nucleotidyltransferase family protein [Candidatus Woesearchaeota archaeon]
MQKSIEQIKKPLTKEEILRKIEKHKDEIKRFRVKKLGLFGSFAKDEQKRGSDLDFLVTFNEVTFDNYMDLKFYLEKLFRKKVDLIIEENLKPRLEYVKQEAIYVKGL